MTPRSASEIDAVMRDDEAVNRALVAAYRRTVLRHRHLGLPMVVWQDGRVVEASADDIELPEPVTEGVPIPK